MSDTDGPAGQELCVLYREAIDWIAFRNFKGRAVGVGPQPLEKLPRFGYDADDDDVEYGIDIGRSILAQELLLDYAAKRRIRVYANEGSTENEASLSFPIQLTAEFLAKAEFDFDQYEGPTLFISLLRADSRQHVRRILWPGWRRSATMGVLKSVEPTGFLAFAPAFAGTNWADVNRRIIQNCPHGRGRTSSSAACLVPALPA